MINVINTALSGLNAAAKKVDAAASNIANVSTTGSVEDGGQAPYSALTTVQKTVVDGEGNGLGARTDIVPKDPGFVPAYAPDSPFANAEGIIGVPNVNLAEEAVNLKLAEISYKASLSVIKTADELSEELLHTVDRDA